MDITPLRLGLDRPGDCELGDWGPRIRIACRHGRFRQFEQELNRQLANKARGPIWIGSGDFHHVSLALLRRVIVPCNVLVLDLHPDWVRGVPFMHCGTWLAHALRLPHVHRVFHVGGDMDFDNRFRHFAPWRDLESGRLKVWPARRKYEVGKWRLTRCEPLHSSSLPQPTNPLSHPSGPLPPCGGGLGWGVEAREGSTPHPNPPPQGGRGPEVGGSELDPGTGRVPPDLPLNFLASRISELLAPHRSDLAARPLYISLDKDVMIQADAITNWEAGFLDLNNVCMIVSAFIGAAKGRLAGMDITGDWSPVRTQGLFRAWLAGTEHPKLNVDPNDAATVNSRTDAVLLEHLRGLDIQWIP